MLLLRATLVLPRPPHSSVYCRENNFFRRLGPNVVRNLIDRCDYKYVSAFERKKKTPFRA